MIFREVPAEAREGLAWILDQSFRGLYLWHARKTLRSVSWVREATQGGATLGVTMSTMLGKATGYVYYAAVVPSQRARGVGGLLLDDAMQFLRARGASEVFVCTRADNTPSVRLLLSRNFTRIGYHDLARSRGFASTARLWMRMVVAPGEKVYRISLSADA
jgi:ribosomal protein S18 acetylase RimI-like enzyme